MIEAGSLIRSLSGRRAAQNFHTFVINEIGGGIVTGKFPVGSILASDAVMMETYGVSRTVLREALKTLESKGMVEARPKVGTRVSPRGRWNFFDPQVLSWHFEAEPDLAFFEDLFEVREALEIRSVHHSVRHRTAEQVRLMKYWAHQMETAGDSLEQHALAALEIHRIVAESSENVLLRSAMGVVELTLAFAVTTDAVATGVRYREAAAAVHWDLIGAIERGRAADASQAMQRSVAIDRRQVFRRSFR